MGGGVFVYKLRVNTEFLLLFVVGVGRKEEEKNEKKNSLLQRTSKMNVKCSQMFINILTKGKKSLKKVLNLKHNFIFIKKFHIIIFNTAFYP